VRPKASWAGLICRTDQCFQRQRQLAIHSVERIPPPRPLITNKLLLLNKRRVKRRLLSVAGISVAWPSPNRNQPLTLVVVSWSRIQIPPKSNGFFVAHVPLFYWILWKALGWFLHENPANKQTIKHNRLWGGKYRLRCRGQSEICRPEFFTYRTKPKAEGDMWKTQGVYLYLSIARKQQYIFVL